MIDWKKLYNKLAFSKPGSWRALSRETGVPPATFTRLKAGKALSAQHLLTLSGFMNLSPNEFRKRPNATRTAR